MSPSRGCLRAGRRPALPLPGQTPARKTLLFLTHAALYKHPSLAPAEAAVTEYGKIGGFDVTTREGYQPESATLDMSFLTPECVILCETAETGGPRT